MSELVKRFIQDSSGATAIEYGLIGAGIFLAIISALTQVGIGLNSTFTTVKSNL